MSWKDELLMLWIFCAVVIAFVARHFWGGAFYVVEQLAAFSLTHIPGLLHVVVGHLR
jgi:hypothetical protein